MDIESVSEKGYFKGIERELLTLLLERGWNEEQVHNFFTQRKEDIPEKMVLVMEAKESPHDLKIIEDKLKSYIVEGSREISDNLILDHDLINGVYTISHNHKEFIVIHYNRLKLTVKIFIRVGEDSNSDIFVKEEDLAMFSPTRIVDMLRI